MAVRAWPAVATINFAGGVGLPVVLPFFFDRQIRPDDLPVDRERLDP